MSDYLAVIAILVLANYLLVLYFVYEDGPFGVFDALRFFIGINAPVTERDADHPEFDVIIGYESNGSFLADLFSCHRCMSPYMAALLALLALLTGLSSLSWPLILVWMATAGGTIIIFEALP